MRISIAATLVSSVIMAGSLLGCGGAKDVDPITPDITAPTVDFADLVVYQGVAGDYEFTVATADDTGLAQIELFLADNETALDVATEAPWTVNWDTTTVSDGWYGLYVRATDLAGNTSETEVNHVYVANDAIIAGLSTGGAGQVDASYLLTLAEQDIKHFFRMPSNITRIVAVLRWDEDTQETPWEFELQVGHGICPHSGYTFPGGVGMSDISPVLVEVTSTTPFEFGDSFAHLRSYNLYDHSGDVVDYQIEVFLYEN